MSIKKRDPITGRALKSGTRNFNCPSCFGPIGQNAYYSGKKCRKCWILSRRTGRKTNAKCSWCNTPIYRPPNVLHSINKFSCSNCKGRAIRERIKNNPRMYEAMLKKAMERKGSHIPKYFCADCNKELVNNSKRCKNCHSLYYRGSKNHQWKGGITPSQKLERTKFHNQIRKKVFERDNYTCQICKNRGVHIQVDHIQPWADYIEGRFNMDNCRTLCVKCHYLITWNKPMPHKTTSWGNRKEGDSYVH